MMDISEAEVSTLMDIAKSILRVVGPIKKRLNARKSLQKALANGSRIGRKRKRDDALILRARKKGMSMREIAKLAEVSLWSVQRSLKDAKK
jgi:hypothetical protein